MNKHKVNNILRFEWDNSGQLFGHAYADSPTDLKLNDVRLVSALDALNEAHTRDEIESVIRDELGVPPERASELFDAFRDNDVLLPESHRNFSEADEWFEKGWRRALYYHLGTCHQNYADADGDIDRRTEDVLSRYLEESSPPSIFIDVEDKETVELPEPTDLVSESLREILNSRRTSRKYSGEEMSLQELSDLLHHTFEPVYEVRRQIEQNIADDVTLYTVSSHVLFDVGLIISRCESIPPGGYLYSIKEHALVPIPETTFETPREADESMTKAAIGQTAVEGAALGVYFVARFDRYQWRYRHSRALRTLYMDVASHSQRLLLVATALNYRTFLTPALRDSYADSLLDTDGYERTPIYFNAIGK